MFGQAIFKQDAHRDIQSVAQRAALNIAAEDVETVARRDSPSDVDTSSVGAIAGYDAVAEGTKRPIQTDPAAVAKRAIAGNGAANYPQMSVIDKPSYVDTAASASGNIVTNRTVVHFNIVAGNPSTRAITIIVADRAVGRRHSCAGDPAAACIIARCAIADDRGVRQDCVAVDPAARCGGARRAVPADRTAGQRHVAVDSATSGVLARRAVPVDRAAGQRHGIAGDPTAIGILARRAVPADRAAGQRHGIAGDPTAIGILARRAVPADRAAGQRHGTAGDPTAMGPVTRSTVTDDAHMVERQARVIGAKDPPATVVIPSRPTSGNCQMSKGDVIGLLIRAALCLQHPARLVRINGDTGAAVDGNVRRDRELAAGEHDGPALHPLGEPDRVRFLGGVRQRQRLAQARHAVPSIDDVSDGVDRINGHFLSSSLQFHDTGSTFFCAGQAMMASGNRSTAADIREAFA